MLPDYEDIRALTTREPNWFDGDGVPRYRPFQPRMLGVYDHYAVLAEIRCQSCHQHFVVGRGWARYSLFLGEPIVHSLDALVDGYHYGDPPCHGGCVGETMNCEDIQIIEAWHRTFEAGWERSPEHEGPLEDNS